MTGKTPHQYGECSDCGRVVPLRNDGLLNAHRPQKGDRAIHSAPVARTWERDHLSAIAERHGVSLYHFVQSMPALLRGYDKAMSQDGAA